MGGELLQPSHNLCGSPLGLLQQLNIFLVLGALELDTVLQKGSHESRIEGWNLLLRCAGHVSLDVTQDLVGGLLGCEHTLLARVESFIKQHPQILLLRFDLKLLSAQLVFLLEIALVKV